MNPKKNRLHLTSKPILVKEEFRCDLGFKIFFLIIFLFTTCHLPNLFYLLIGNLFTICRQYWPLIYHLSTILATYLPSADNICHLFTICRQYWPLCYHLPTIFTTYLPSADNIGHLFTICRQWEVQN